jgi:hypothetical protein
MFGVLFPTCIGLVVQLLPAVADVHLESVEDLSQQYGNIFKTGNRNAASHLWSTFILSRASSLPAATIERLFTGFCPISGSPLPEDPHTRYWEVLTRIDGSRVAGISHHCCWPCICDEQDFTRVDKKTIHTSSGPQTYDVIVIGDPCKHPDKLDSKFVDPFSQTTVSLMDEAPEVKCEDGKLKGATFSDAGYPILGMFFTGPPGLEGTFQNASSFKSECDSRKKAGYNSGMGLIFDKVASITPLGKSLDVTALAASTGRTTVEAKPSWPSSAQNIVALGLFAMVVAGAIVAAKRRGGISNRPGWASQRRKSPESGEEELEELRYQSSVECGERLKGPAE